MNIDEQNAHPLYKDAHERFLRAEMEQNIKAATKYPEPLNPASWTAEGLADHAAQEAVDMLRYIEALKAKCEMQRSEIAALNLTQMDLESHNYVMKEAIDKAIRELAELGKAAKKLPVAEIEHKLDDAMDYLSGASANYEEE